MLPVIATLFVCGHWKLVNWPRRPRSGACPPGQVQRASGSRCPLGIPALRSLGAHANVFAIESFMDELAESAGADPVAFRLRHLKDPGTIADGLLERFSLSDAATRRVATYSGGMRRRLDIAMSLIGHSPVIFLDEPTAGLDPEGRIEVWQAVKDLAEGGTTVLLTTQYLEEAERLADRIAILQEGRIIANGTLAELKRLLPPATVEYVERQPTLEDVFLAIVGATGTVNTADAATTTTKEQP